MVVFICDGCQESLNRGKVKTHILQCRKSYVLSCVDCGARFEGNAYEKHTSCYSESEKYTGKRDKKQDEWSETVQEALESITDMAAKNGFESIIAKIGETTVPRKKPKFVNMCKSSHAYLKPATVDTIWTALEQAIKRKAEEREKIRQAEILKKKEMELQKKAEADSGTTKEKQGNEAEEPNLESQKKRLKKLLKKADGQSILFTDLADDFGSKKAIKRLAKSYPDTFAIEKVDSHRAIKLARFQDE